MNIFDILNSISFGKNDLSEEPDFESVYNSFLINRYVSMLPDTQLYAFYADKLSSLPKKLQYLFYLNGLPKKKRYFEYKKKAEKELNVTYIMKYFQVNEQKALNLLNVLPDDSVKEINKLMMDLEKQSKS